MSIALCCSGCLISMQFNSANKIKGKVLHVWASLVAQTLKNPPAMWETWLQSLGWEDPLEEGMATHSSVFAWRIPWTDSLEGYGHWVAKRQTRRATKHSTAHYIFVTQPLTLIIYITVTKPCSIFGSVTSPRDTELTLHAGTQTFMSFLNLTNISRIGTILR